MDNKFVAIVNPFGEIYPERDTEKRPALNKIKDYVSDGGIFVNAGGYAFFYAYDVAKGKRMELTSEIERWPSKMSIKNGNIQVQEFQTVLKFTGTPLYKDFGIITTSGGDPEQQNKVEAYQTQDDKSRFGELMTPGEPAEIIEYRAVTRESKGVIPVIRVIMPEDAREVYPIALVEFGYGHLLLCGMKINGEPEFGKIIMAVDRVCDWASSLG
jgi:hypothetical protein